MASLTKRSESKKPWQVRYRDPEGKSKSKQFARKVDAQRFSVTVGSDKLRGTYVDPAAGKVSFREFAEQWLAALTVDAKTREGIASHLRAHLVPALARWSCAPSGRRRSSSGWLARRVTSPRATSGCSCRPCRQSSAQRPRTR